MMLPSNTSHPSAHSVNPVPLPADRFPVFFRLTRFSYSQMDHQTYRCEAAIYHDSMSLQVTWEACQPDIRLRQGVLVRVCWTRHPYCRNGYVRIGRLVLSETPSPGFDLLATVPSGWVKDRSLVERARGLTARLSAPQLHLFNVIFWDGRRFHRFLSGPSSLNGHHSGPNGNFRHSIDVAERCLAMAADKPRVARDLLILAALLHDAGKADEYTYDRDRQRFEMSDRGVSARV